MRRLCLGAICAAACAALLHILLAGWVLQDSLPTSSARLSHVPFKLSARLAIEGLAPPAWAYRGWLQESEEQAWREESMLAKKPSTPLRDAYLGNARRILGWLIVLACVERWGALCEWIRVGLVRLGMTSRPPAQKSSLTMRGLRQGLAIVVCAAAMLVLALGNPAYDHDPVRVAPAIAEQGLAWGPWAPWLAFHGLLP